LDEIKQIGAGAFSQVYLAKELKTESNVCLKIVNLFKVNKQEMNAHNEMKVWMKLFCYLILLC
jgi:serine/threonine protein kinase